MRVTGTVRGRDGWKAVFAAMPEAIRNAHGEANRVTAEEVVASAQAGVAFDTGTLKQHIASKFYPRSGNAKVGIATGEVLVHGRVYRATHYAHMVEFGTVNMAAQPFMHPAIEGARASHEERHRAAGQVVEQDLAGRAVNP